MTEVGDDVLGPDGCAYRCFAPGRRSSTWISDDATMRTRYHDTGAWSRPLAPRSEGRSGALLAPNGTRMEQALATAWMADTAPSVGRRDCSLVDPRAGQTAANVRWARPGDGTTSRAVRPPPPCVLRAARAALTAADLPHLAATTGLTEETALNYLCKAAAHDPSLVPRDVGVRVCTPAVWDAVAQLPLRDGPLRPLVEAARERAGWLRPNAVRLARLLLESNDRSARARSPSPSAESAVAVVGRGSKDGVRTEASVL